MGLRESKAIWLTPAAIPRHLQRHGGIHVFLQDSPAIVLTSPNFVHGFAIPDFNVRGDGIPGKTVEITFVADKAGKFIYLCDNFCGEGHDKMTGFLIVTKS